MRAEKWPWITPEIIRKTDKGVSFTVEKSDFEYVAEGEVYDYIREE